VLVLVDAGVVEGVAAEPGEVEKTWLASPPVHYPQDASVSQEKGRGSDVERTWYVCGAPTPLVRSRHCVPPVIARCWSLV
jgi:hypothetical protein